MKKILPIIFITFLAFQLQAQYKPVLFGMRAAVNVGWIKPDVEDYQSDGVLAGFTWGFIGEFFLMENYAVLSGFNVNFNGGKMNYPAVMDIDSVATVGSLDRTYHLKYLQIPLCLKMQTDLSEKVTIFGKIGLGTSFNLSAKADDVFTYEGGEMSKLKVNIDEDIALVRESLIVGGGVEFKIKGSTAVIIDLTYDNAFNNMLTGENPAVEGEPRAIHNFVELGAGIVF
jgi:hypothetical protein